MDGDRQRLLSVEEEKDRCLSATTTVNGDVLQRGSKPQLQRWKTRFVFIHVALIVLYTVISAIIVTIHINKALSPHGTHFRYSTFVLSFRLITLSSFG